MGHAIHVTLSSNRRVVFDELYAQRVFKESDGYRRAKALGHTGRIGTAPQRALAGRDILSLCLSRQEARAQICYLQL